MMNTTRKVRMNYEFVHLDTLVLTDQQKTFHQQFSADTECRPVDLPNVMAERGRERESKETMRSAGLDDE